MPGSMHSYQEMLTLSAKIRKITGKKVKTLRKAGLLPAILYGPKTRPLALEIDLKDFEKVFKEAGESSLISLKVGGKARNVLVHDVQADPVKGNLLHVDLYQPLLKEEVTVTIPLVFEGEPQAVKELAGVLVKNISELEVRGLAQNLPKAIEVNVEGLKTFDDSIKIRDLRLAKDIEILKDSDEIVASVVPPVKEEVPPEKVEEEVAEEEIAGEKIEKKEESK